MASLYRYRQKRGRSRLVAEYELSNRRVWRWKTHGVSPLPVFIGVIAFEYAFRDMCAFLDHEFVKWIREVASRYPAQQHPAVWLRGMLQ